MKTVSGARDFKSWQGWCVVGAMVVAYALTKLFGLSALWRDASVYTVIVFSGVVLALRLAWRRAVFWRNLLFIFGLHSLVVVWLFRRLPPSYSVPGLLLIAAAMFEGVLLVNILWTMTAESKSKSKAAIKPNAPDQS